MFLSINNIESIAEFLENSDCERIQYYKLLTATPLSFKKRVLNVLLMSFIAFLSIGEIEIR